eukprot:2866858-Rhodomonas_salina.1
MKLVHRALSCRQTLLIIPNHNPPKNKTCAQPTTHMQQNKVRFTRGYVCLSLRAQAKAGGAQCQRLQWSTRCPSTEGGGAEARKTKTRGEEAR